MPRLRTRPARSASLAAPDDAQLGPSAEQGTSTAGAAGLAAPAVETEPTLVADTRRRLDAIVPDLVSDDLRAAVLTAAWAAHRRGGFSSARSLLAASCSESLAVDDWQSAARAKADLDALDRLADELPATTIPAGVGLPALQRAALWLSQRADLITVPQSSYVVEHETWKQTPRGWLMDPDRPRPASLISDRRAVALIEELRRRGAALRSGIDSIADASQPRRATDDAPAVRPTDPDRANPHRSTSAPAPSQVDVLGLLETATSYAALLDEFADQAANAERAITEANASRIANGATWETPAAWRPSTAVPTRVSLV